MFDVNKIITSRVRARTYIIYMVHSIASNHSSFVYQRKRRHPVKGAVFHLAMCDLEISCLWSTWERNHVADILHAGDKQDEALETET